MVPKSQVVSISGIDPTGGTTMDKEKGRIWIVAVVIVAVVIIAAAAMALVPRDITVSSVGDGEISFEGTKSVNGIGSLEIDIQPGEGMTAYVYLDDKLVCTGCDSYTYEASMLDFSSHSIKVVFTTSQPEGTFTLTVVSNTGGQTSPSGENHYAEGTTQRVTITPDEGYAISDVKVDGVSVGTESSVEVVMDSDHTVEVTFVTSAGVVEHIITASAGSGGSITPSGEVKVKEGSDQTFTVKANSGYRVSQVLVDGKAVTLTNGTYTFEDVSSEHSISVTFRYTGGGSGGGTTPSVTLQSISVSGAKTTYLAGQTFDTSGMTVTAHYSDGTTKTVTDFTVSPSGQLTVDVDEVTITYQGKTATVEIVVVSEDSLQSIEITTGPTRTHYFDDQDFDKTGISVSGVYVGGVKIALEEGAYTVSESNGTVTVTLKSNPSKTDTTTVQRDLKITSLEELMHFASNVNNGVKTYENLTVTLDTDIDLEGEEWTPIGISEDSENVFKGIFDGAGHTISGLTINSLDATEKSAAGFFGALKGTVKDLTFEDAKVGHLSIPYLDMDGDANNVDESTQNGIGVVAGSLTESGSIENVTIRNSEVSGNRYVAGVVGYIYGSVSVSGCTVENVTLEATPDNCTGAYDNGDKVGGIVGYAGYDGVTVTNCEASNVHITGYRDMGIIIGATQPESENRFGGFTVGGNNTITVDQKTHSYGEKDANANRVIGRVVNDGPYDDSKDNIEGTVTIIDKDTIVIENAEDLMDFAEKVNGGETFDGKLVVLTADIDMRGYDWIPIGDSAASYPSNSFYGEFDGAGHTISNLTSAPGRKSNTDTNAADGLFGTLCGEVRNVNLDKVRIHGTHWVGAIVGYSSANTATVIENCHVTNATLTSSPVIPDGPDGLNGYNNGDKVGGIVGYIVTNDQVINCSVENATITGFRDLGGIAGYSTGTIQDCSVYGVTIIQDDTNPYTADTTTLGEIVGRNVSSILNNNTSSNVTIITDETKVVIKTKEDLINFADAVNTGTDYSDKVVILDNDIDLTGVDWTPIGTTTNDFRGVFDGQGHKISNLNVNKPELEGVGLFGWVKDGSVRNLFVDNAIVTGKSSVGVIAGAYTVDIIECHITGLVQVTGNYKVGGVVGYVYGDVTNCSINADEGSFVKGEYGAENFEGDNVGGAIGYTGEGNHVHSGISISNLDVEGTRKVGGVVGFLEYGVSLRDSSYSDGDVSSNAADNYVESSRSKGIFIGGIVGEFSGNTSKAPCEISGCTASDVTVNGPIVDNLGEIYGGTRNDATHLTESNNTYENVVCETIVDSPESLQSALSDAADAHSGDTLISIENDLDMTDAYWVPITVDGYYGAGVVTIEGNGHTITNLDAALFKGGFAGSSGIVIRNLTISGSEITDSTNTEGVGAFIESVDSMEVILLENCHLIDSTITSSNGARVGGLIGWTSGHVDVHTKVTVTGCSVVDCTITANGSVGGLIGHAGTNPYTMTEVENCIVKGCTLTSTDAGDWRVGVAVGTANVGETIISDIKSEGNTPSQVDKTAPDGQSDLYGRFVPGDTGSLIIDGSSVSA